MYYLTAGCFFRNEFRYMREWIEFHLLVGVEHFYMVCNDDRVEPAAALLREYLMNGLVSLYHLPGANAPVQQMRAYNTIIRKAEAKWVAFIDMDEFLYSPKADDVRTILPDYEQYGAVCVNWACFGSSGYLFPVDLQTESFTRRASDDDSDNTSIKSIIDPSRTVEALNPHTFAHSEGYFAVDEFNQKIEPGVCYNAHQKAFGQRLRINHYRVRSYADFIEKSRRWAGRGHPMLGNVKDIESYWRRGDKNDVEDLGVSRFVPRLRAAMPSGPTPRPPR